MPDNNDFQQDQFKSFQIPANLMAAEFGEVNVRRNLAMANSQITECRVEFTIAMEPQGQFAEGWRTGLALDASASMKRAYGRKVQARVDPELLTGYIKQGRLQAYIEDGEPTRKIQREAFVEIQEKGYAIHYTENILQPLVQDFIAYLADNLDRTGKTSLIYWGCGKGEEIQVLGEFDAVASQQIKISGPATFQLGKTTKLCPAIAYFADQYQQAPRGIYIFLTDGRIDDLEEVKSYTKELALEIVVGKRNYLKLVLIGIGNDVDRYQLQELDDFDTGLDIDLWDYKIASEMKNLSQIFAELVNDNQIVAENGSIYDDRGNCVKSYPQGLPAKVNFGMPNDSQWFELEVRGKRIRQSVVFDNAIAPLIPKKLFDFELKAQESSESTPLINSNPSINLPINQNTAQSAIQPQRWKWITALLIGTALIGIALIGIAIALSKNIPKSTAKPPSNVPSGQNPIIPINPITSISPLNPIKPLNPIGTIQSKNLITEDTSAKNPQNPQNNLAVNNSSANSQKETRNQKICESLGICFADSNKFSRSNNRSKLETVSPTNPSTPLLNSSKQTKNSDRNTSASIVPISNPDVEAIIFFPSDDSQLMPTEVIKIDKFLTKIQGRRGVIQVSGHADITGDYTYNLDLSQARANEVVKQLRDRGIDSNYRITFEALSWLHPLRKKASSSDNAFNRRVVIQFQEQK